MDQQSIDNHKGLSTGSRSGWLNWAVLILIFAVGLAVRLYELDSPPVDFHPTRQLHSALIARGMYFEQNLAVPDWQRQMAVNQWQTEGLIEPQVFERLTAGTYAVLGRVDLRAPRLYAIVFWLAAGVFITMLALQLTGWGGAFVAALFFLVWPYGVVASRAFQPEPLMIALMAAGLWAALRWQARGGWGWALLAGVLAGLSIYIKSVALFFMGPALAVLVLYPRAESRPGWSPVRSPQVWVMAGLAILPYLVYTVDGLYLHKYLVGQLSLRFFPEMWLDPAFYLRWISNLGRVVPFEMLLTALLGAFLIKRPAARAMVLAMWVGYFVYGMALPHHISTHDYYHLPLFIALGLGLGAVGQVLLTSLRGPIWLTRLAAAAVLTAALVINGYGARTAIKRSGAWAQAAAWTAVGQTIPAGAGVVALVDDYGSGLKYYAWINPVLWPTSDDIQFRQSVGEDQSFDTLFAGRAAERDFFVVSPPTQLDDQPMLKKLLTEHYPLLAQGPGYLIYDLRASQPAP